MRRNLDLTHGLLFAERAALALTPHMGRAEAHALVKRASEQAAREGGGLRGVLEADPTACAALAGRFDEIFDPAPTLAAVPELIRRMIGRDA